ncbi:DGAT1/2-independent enzyme synthesizing storage lipids-like isoform X2 [Pithys albifrons albifrons]|uniref:DGAT1/2-independent enzyme synthesizing storage lipids-like isoform X2 n=1 Tax=Pithys albifrons albifrons TaxID=3385563 RepID=UPI003A5CF276
MGSCAFNSVRLALVPGFFMVEELKMEMWARSPLGLPVPAPPPRAGRGGGSAFIPGRGPMRGVRRRRHWQDMIGRKESCTSGQISMTDLSCLVYALEEWTVAEFLKKYLFHLIIASLTISAILVFFIVPLIIVFFIYLTNFSLLIYQRKSELKADPLSDVWDSARKSIATFWDIYARIWHGYELHGVENLPDGPGILVYYHGAIPIDYLYFLSRLFLWKKRVCLSVADHFVFRLPGLKFLLEVTGIILGTREECLMALKNGYLVSISPGGVREALFSDENYQLIWGNRKGFAQVARDARVPIIPMYTQNVREGYRTFKERRFLRQLYESTRLPFTPPYGGLPVKFRTYIGKPIPYDPNITTEELVEKTKTAVQALIRKHQTIPGSIWKALLERFDKRRKSD